MKKFYRSILLGILLCSAPGLYAQTIIKGKIMDATSKEPIAGASIHCMKEGCHVGCMSNASGEFEIHCQDCQKFLVSSIGYAAQEFTADNQTTLILLTTAASQLQEVVFTANRGEAVKRSAAPVAISSITSKTIQETKPTSADQVLNKVSGVNMVNLGNEQHQMSIRQPMTTKSLFLYLEDGVPIRTSGLYNHNALLEMNMAATKSINPKR